MSIGAIWSVCPFCSLEWPCWRSVKEELAAAGIQALAAHPHAMTCFKVNEGCGKWSYPHERRWFWKAHEPGETEEDLPGGREWWRRRKAEGLP